MSNLYNTLLELPWLFLFQDNGWCSDNTIRLLIGWRNTTPAGIVYVIHAFSRIVDCWIGCSMERSTAAAAGVSQSESKCRAIVSLEWGISNSNSANWIHDMLLRFSSSSLDLDCSPGMNEDTTTEYNKCGHNRMTWKPHYDQSTLVYEL